MLSWASYLFGGGSSDPQPDESQSQPEQAAPMETEAASSEKDWVVVEHGGNKDSPQVGITDLENLLIEHPSMSVYKRSGSTGEESNQSESSSDEVSNSKRSQAVSRQGPKRVRIVSARAELLAQVSQVKRSQTLQQKKTTKRNNKKNLQRMNNICDKKSPKANRVRKPSGQMNGRIPQRKL